MPEAPRTNKNKKFRSLTVTIVFVFMALSILTLLASAGSLLLFSYKAQEKAIASEQGFAVNQAAEEVNTFVKDKQEILDQAADLNNLATSADRRSLVMNKLLGRNPAFRQLFLIDPNGSVLERVSRLPSFSTDPLETYKVPLLASSRADLNYISPVYIDPTTSEPIVLVAVPAKNILRDPLGAFVAEVNLKFMWDLVSSIGADHIGQAYVVDRQGTLIAFRDVSRVLAREDVRNVYEVQEFMESTMEEEDTPAYAAGIDGTKVIATHKALGDPDWGIIVEWPVMDAFSVIVQGLWFSLGYVIVGAILALLAGFYFSKWITKGIIDLNVAAEEISKGNLDARVSLTSDNEIGHLAESFNSMAGKLKEIYANLDAKVREKTNALTVQVAEAEKSKSAILNLLEDIEEEKKKVDETVKVRTKELSDEKARLLASINSLSFGFVIIDGANNILIKNPALSRILEVVDEPRNLGDIAKYLRDFDLVALCKESVVSNKFITHSDISYGKKYLRVSCAPVLEQLRSGLQVIGNVVLVEDITEAKVMERSRDEFFAVASHELRTPLTAIRGNADMILEMYSDKIVDKDMKEMLQDINVSSVRLIAVVNDFLEVSRLEQGKIQMKIERFNPMEVVEKVHRDLKEMISKKGLSLVIAPAPASVPDIIGDKNRVEQILVNFIGNATKFTKEGTITVSLEPESGKMRFRVIDTGTGISEHNQALLFRKFQQAGEQMLARDVSQSTGLGLYICKLIVANMNGEIGLEKSELGKGSTFFFTMPLAA